MYSFIVLCWNRNDPASTEIANSISEHIHNRLNSWTTVFAQQGMIGHHSNEQPGRVQAYPLDGRNSRNPEGIVLGKLFRQNSSYRVCTQISNISTTESEKIILTGGRHLVDYYWGRYIAFINNNILNKHQILRSPKGDLPCYYTNIDGVDIYFSNLRDVIQLSLLKFSFNWKFIAAYSAFGFIQSNETGLNEINELLPGQRLEKNMGVTSKKFLWNPIKISQEGIIEDPNEAIRKLHLVTHYCVSTWANCYKKILHRLSGGLDSSLVLGCLRHHTKTLNITCLNYYTDAMDGDERQYAQISADHAKVTLIEKYLDHFLLDLKKIINVRATPAPIDHLYALERGGYEITIAEEVGAEAIWSGIGGDNAFFTNKSNWGARDYLAMHGLRLPLFKLALEASRLQEVSIWTSLRDLLLHNPIRQGGIPFGGKFGLETEIFNTEILGATSIKNTLHPLLQNEGNQIPDGKLNHVFFCLVNPLYYEPSLTDDHIEPVNPLASQPLVDLCLKIPTYILNYAGKSRGLARLAFTPDVPMEILQRESKGTPENYYKIAFANNIDFIREFLLEGHMVKEKLLNRDNLERVLSGDCSKVNPERVNILTHLSTEAWLRKWVTS